MKKHTSLVIALVAAGGAVRLGLALGLYEHFIDDTYIFMRYSENLAAGRGLVYNVGERVMGFTSVLYAVLLGLLKSLLYPVPLAALVHFLSAVVFVVSAALVHLLTRRDGRPDYLSLVIFLFYFPFVDASLTGMESGLFCLWILATLVAIRAAHFRSACFLAAIAVLTRPEGIFLLLPTMAFAFFAMPRRRFLVTALGVAALGAAVAGALWWYYGTVIPHSMVAKSSVSNSSWAGIWTSPVGKAVCLAIGTSDDIYTALPRLVQYAMISVIAATLALIATQCSHFWRRRREFFVSALFLVLVLAFYVAGNPVRIFSWYTVPTSLCFALLACAAARHVAEQRGWRIDRWAPWVAAGGCVLALVAVTSLRAVRIDRHVGDLGRLAEELRETFPKANSLMVGDIGIIGYRLPVRVVDLAGLVSPIAVAHPEQEVRSLGDLVALTKPDLICLREDPLEHEDILESFVRYRCFSGTEQRAAFATDYAQTNLGSRFYPHVFVRR